MLITLTKIGNSKGIIIDKIALDLLKITDDTPLKLSLENNSLVITPVITEDLNTIISSLSPEQQKSITSYIEFIASSQPKKDGDK
jgi:antitoxin component of MazEF toxin-antitoxin module